MDVAPGTLVVFADLGCPWAHVAVRRLWAARERAGRVEELRFDIRAFHDQLLGMGALPLSVLDVEMRAWIAAQSARR